MLAIATVLLLPAYLTSCAAGRKVNKNDCKQDKIDSTEIFVPTHPPVVVPHSWKDCMKK